MTTEQRAATALNEVYQILKRVEENQGVLGSLSGATQDQTGPYYNEASRLYARAASESPVSEATARACEQLAASARDILRNGTGNTTIAEEVKAQASELASDAATVAGYATGGILVAVAIGVAIYFLLDKKGK